MGLFELGRMEPGEEARARFEMGDEVGKGMGEVGGEGVERMKEKLGVEEEGDLGDQKEEVEENLEEEVGEEGLVEM